MRDSIDLFYAKQQSPLEFKFDSLVSRPLFSMIPIELDTYLYSIATNLRLNSKIKEKYKLIDDALAMYGFELLARGTNRSTYRYFNDDTIVLKVGYDKAGIHDAQREFYNQQVLKPFVTKCFEVSPSGTIGLFERVNPITYKEEFKSIAEDVFELLTKFILGKYILADIGTDFYMNWGLRSGFGPVLLDYPFMYELDGKRLHCINQIKAPDGRMIPCNGLIDYDDGFNHLVCEKCGKQYFAQDLAKYNTSTGQLEVVRGALGGYCMPRVYKDGRLIGQFGQPNPLGPTEEASPFTPLRAFLNGRDEELARLDKMEKERAKQLAMHQQQFAAQQQQMYQQQPQPTIEIEQGQLFDMIKGIVTNLVGPHLQQVFQQPQQNQYNPVFVPPSQQQVDSNYRATMVQNMVQQQPVQQQPQIPTQPVTPPSQAEQARKEAIQRQLKEKNGQHESRKFQESRQTPQSRMNYLFSRLKRRFGDLYCGNRVSDHELLTFFVMGALTMVYESEGKDIPNDLGSRSIETVNDFIKEIMDNIDRKRQRQQGNQQPQQKRQQNQRPQGNQQPAQQQVTQRPVQQQPTQQVFQQPVQQQPPVQQQVTQRPVQQQQPRVFDKENRIGNPYDDPVLNVHNDDVSEEVENQFQEVQDESEIDLENHLNDINPTSEQEQYSESTQQALEQITQQAEEARSKF